ncbi:MAG: PASTA domain-containing protein [Candidatus Magnetoglobus multicellularis str. Araruama]|uniref:PASTA domain-containing protein n=1 Tax=Candidatus Magnetoglobus multicellularis str. Araruama TaxID=890399 RepID=A0A1V1PHL5_9BACT|nr:MAG: PASTA domain-containing protein [Candidatus Magnetoglobus multicellularis str. Araruama]
MFRQSIQIIIGLIVFVIIFILTTYFSVYIFVKTEKYVIIPDVTGKDIIYVLELLSDNRLNTKVDGTEYHSTIPKNHVIYQDPKPGSEVKEGRDVSIVLSKGSKWLRLPDIRGMPIEKAQIVLDQHRLCRGEITRIYHPQFVSGMIIYQFPEPGSYITNIACIDILVSRGHRSTLYQMPDFIGVSIEEALMMLSTINIQPFSIKYASDNQWPENRIIEQKPAFGYAITKEEPVYLTVNRKNLKIGDSKGGISLYVYSVPNGFLQKHVLIRLNIFGVTIHVHDDFIRPAKKIYVLIPNDCDASVFVYQDETLVDSKIF